MAKTGTLVVGGDGYCGWATALYLGARGHRVAILDNLIRRRWDVELGIHTLTRIQEPERRLRTWHDLTGQTIEFFNADVCDYAALSAAMRSFEPDAIVHFGEQRSAPFSMLDREHAVMTQTMNVTGTLNVLFAMRDHAPDAHLVKLGSMGTYGTPNLDIEEGWIDLHHNGRDDRVLFPKRAGSFYHLSKVHDGHNIEFACRCWGIRATDLNQGIVYGTADQTELHPDLVNRFDYDEIFGTALNRFCVQAAAGLPLTVYGKGGQTRGYLDIRDTVRCVELAIESPAEPGDYRVFNQFTEVFGIAELAEKVAAAARGLGLPGTVQTIPNPRVESEAHRYSARNDSLLQLGLKPHELNESVIVASIELALRNRDRIDPLAILPTVEWRTPGTYRPSPASRLPVRA